MLILIINYTVVIHTCTYNLQSRKAHVPSHHGHTIEPDRPRHVQNTRRPLLPTPRNEPQQSQSIPIAAPPTHLGTSVIRREPPTPSGIGKSTAATTTLHPAIPFAYQAPEGLPVRGQSTSDVHRKHQTVPATSSMHHTAPNVFHVPAAAPVAHQTASDVYREFPMPTSTQWQTFTPRHPAQQMNAYPVPFMPHHYNPYTLLQSSNVMPPVGIAPNSRDINIPVFQQQHTNNCYQMPITNNRHQ